MLLPIKIPPGLVIAGTNYQSKGHWVNANLIRFFERSIRPVGGWELIYDIGEPARGIHAWRSNDSAGRLIIGTADSVFAYANGNITDITPGTFGAPDPDPDPPAYVPSSYGVGSYGVGKYGSNRVIVPPATPTDDSIPLQADDDATWVFDNFGEIPLGVMSSDGKIRSWSLEEDENFEIISDLAPDCRALVVTPERFVLALGASTRSQGFLVLGSLPLDGEEVVIDATTYTFKTAITTAAGDVDIGATIEDSLTNLVAAINQASGAGTLYGDDTIMNPAVIATPNLGSLGLIVSARVSGSIGDGIVLTTNVTDGQWTTVATSDGEGSPCNVRWPSQESLTDWTPTADNTAGDFPLASVGRAMNGKRMPRETLIWTDADLHAAIYVGGTVVYTFEWRGDKCGAISPNSMAVVGDTAYWMGDNGFFRYDGAVSSIPCDVHDYVFRKLNKQKSQRVYAVSVSQYGEMWWYYPADDSEEVNAYVVYNYKENHWNVGTLARTAGVDRGVFLVPIKVGPDGKIWKHETGLDNPGADPIYVESGPVEIEEGNNVWMVRRLVPDEANLGAVSVYVAASFWPTDALTFIGPLSPLAPTPIRLTGRQMSFKLQETEDGSDFRIGVWRVDAAACGER